MRSILLNFTLLYKYFLYIYIFAVNKYTYKHINILIGIFLYSIRNNCIIMLEKYLVISKKQASVLQINFGKSKIYVINQEKRLGTKTIVIFYDR